MIINIVAGGPVDNLPVLTDKRWRDAVWIGVDRGVIRLLEKQLKPFKAFGDFDSISSKELTFVRDQLKNIAVFPSEKDEVDLELALNWAMEQEPALIRIFGATGGRMDHMFGAVQLLYKGLKSKINIELIDKQNIISMHEAGTYYVEKDASYRYISFLPFTCEVEALTLEGFKYPLIEYKVLWGSTLCISNELLKQRGTFSFAGGILMMVRSND